MPEIYLTARIDLENSETLAKAQAHGAYETAKRVFKEIPPAEVTEIVKAAGLRGRGGAGFPAGLK